ncbi:MAG: potassium channel family protein, partial [Planctomycetota bacterium]
KRIDALHDHTIICGCGETGFHITRELIATRRPFVIIESNLDRIAALEAGLGEVLHIDADASEDAVLLKAGIDRAEGLISALPSDKDNLLVTITARQLNPDLRIISRCVDMKNGPKLKKAGADSVVSPNMIGGLRMVSEMIRPSVVTFLDVMLRDKRQVRIEEAVVKAGSPYAGSTLQEAHFRQQAAINIIATRGPDEEEFTYNPHASTPLKEGTTLIIIGAPSEIAKVRAALNP